MLEHPAECLSLNYKPKLGYDYSRAWIVGNYLHGPERIRDLELLSGSHDFTGLRVFTGRLSDAIALDSNQG